MKKDKHISVVLETETYNELAILAVEDRRTVGNLVRYIVKRYIQGVAEGSIKLSIHTMRHG